MSRDSVVRGHRTFRVLLDCMARPGSVREVPQAAGWSSALEGLALALLDSESGAAVLDPELTGIVLAALEPVGCPLLAPEEAGFVVAEGSMPCDLSRLRTGSADYPDDSATLVYLVEALASTGGEMVWKGPGIDGSASPRLDGLAPEVLPSLQAINASYPIGLDAFFLDRSGRVMALPRSTRIEGGML